MGALTVSHKTTDQWLVAVRDLCVLVCREVTWASVNDMFQWEFPCLPRRSAEPKYAWLPVHMPPSLQQLHVCPYSLSPLLSLYLSFTLYLFLSLFSFQWGRKGGEIAYRDNITFAALTASRRGGRVNRPPVAQERGRPEQTTDISLKVPAPFLLVSVASYHPMWSQLQRKSRQTPFGFEFPWKEDDCLVSPAQEGIWKTARPCLTPFFPLLPILFFRCFHVFPVETATGAEHLWFQITLVELQSTQHHCLETQMFQDSKVLCKCQRRLYCMHCLAVDHVFSHQFRALQGKWLLILAQKNLTLYVFVTK